MAEARIIDSRRIPSVLPDRLGKFTRLITYTMGVGQTFVVTLNDEDANEQNILAAVKRDVETNRQHVGKTVTV